MYSRVYPRGPKGLPHKFLPLWCNFFSSNTTPQVCKNAQILGIYIELIFLGLSTSLSQSLSHSLIALSCREASWNNGNINITASAK